MPPPQPEAASGYTEKPGWATAKFAVAAANPLATDAGYQVLKAGGSAIDAAIAVQMVLTLVEPQSSGIGADGKPMSFIDGVPGTVRMLEMAHQQYGKLPWAQLFVPAITLAEGGFKISARLNTLLKTEQHLKKDPVAAAYFYQASGSKGLHEGELAQAIVSKVQNHPTNPGRLSLADMAAYQAKKREPICHDYRAQARDYRICGMPPPSSGAIAVGQILGILNNTRAATLALDTGMCGTPGSPGGALIIHYTAKTLYGVLNWGLLPQQAINLPNFASLNGTTLLEEKRFAPAAIEALRTRGAEVIETSMTSSLQAIARGQAHGATLWLGGADPRREGVVMGD
ncbi:MAG: gamma-glutamyltransferase [Rhodoferax sp.]|nr:gamma-glutamyltransferase [Rhodoferax sp.]